MYRSFIYIWIMIFMLLQMLILNKNMFNMIMDIQSYRIRNTHFYQMRNIINK